MSLNDLRIGESAIIKSVAGDQKLTKRLFALGCIEGTPVKLKRVAPLGDPIIINVRGFDLAIRKKDADNIFLHN
ncbi:ferrous iron transport protein A [Clostridium sp. DSM 8431]|uniref:FeoA family protein n=1 Tax=Clostridium sp. DSM 8431 TaxID=1761781 RepID=UPI0008F23E09|nr:ferrous iron transport protein A [Clostridium sp. DSM 8431]SFU56835.1 ferrous iron transport protein A [Clostridium sp. DSM 8431]